KVATVDAAGVVKALKPGKVKITVYAGSKKKTYSIAVAQIVAPAVVPVISGTLTVDQMLTVDPGVWGPGVVTLSYQWYRGSKAIAGATGATYVLDAADAGKTVKVKVTGTKPGYNTVSKTSKATKKIAKAVFSASPVPLVSGTPTVGQVLTADAGVWTPVPDKFTYQWYRSGKAISKATGSTYLLVAADAGKEISVKVTASKAGYNTVSLTSAKTAPVAAA
ncbi:MAG: Ig-like domain-containing protein, partial [Propionibacteriaceae bacterium]|nr:Ig-like domain-containing protein [Propionibacteriaceae bacterium]